MFSRYHVGARIAKHHRTISSAVECKPMVSADWSMERWYDDVMLDVVTGFCLFLVMFDSSVCTSLSFSEIWISLLIASLLSVSPLCHDSSSMPLSSTLFVMAH